MERRNNVCISQAGGDGSADNGIQAVRISLHLMDGVSAAHLVLIWKRTFSFIITETISCREPPVFVFTHVLQSVAMPSTTEKKLTRFWWLSDVRNITMATRDILLWLVTTLFLRRLTSLALLFSSSWNDRNFKTYLEMRVKTCLWGSKVTTSDLQ